MTLNEVMADVKHEGDTDPFVAFEKPEADKETETPTDSPAVKEVKVEEPIQGDNTEVKKEIPFHEHPRWKEREAELQELRAFKESAAPKLSELEQKLKPSEKSNIPEWFKELYGENEVAWQKYSEHTQQEREQMTKDILAQQEAKREEAQKEETYWNNWVEEGVKGLQLVGLEFDRNALLKTMLDNPKEVTNALGNFDFNLGYKLYREKNPINQVNSEARKKLADTATKSSPSEKSSKDFMTSNELRGKSWNQL